jgi:hypothetical protein
VQCPPCGTVMLVKRRAVPTLWDCTAREGPYHGLVTKVLVAREEP